MLNQLIVHFSTNKILHNDQYGFTKGRSTTDAGVALLRHIFDAWENSQNAIGVFCDLSKAFDCVQHDTLVRKLRHYGVKDAALSLIISYLTDRSQCVDINGVKSSKARVQIGVPQGSILGPFLFLVYINDLPYYIKNICDVVLFADDTSLIFKVDRKKVDFDDVNLSLGQILSWFETNNLLLNAKKTKCLNFALPNVKSLKPKLTIDNAPLDLVDTTTFLGITVDHKLQWGAHVSHLAGRLSSAAYAVRKVRQFTDVDTARLVYFSYFHSVMSYGILLWGNAADIETVFVLQKRAVRAIYQLRTRVSLRERFKVFGILTVASQYIYSNMLYVHQNKDNFQKNSDLHNRNTRNKHKLVVPYFRLHKVHGSFMGLSKRLYNKLPKDVHNLNLYQFKKYIKQSLIKKAYYTVRECLEDKSSL